MRVAYLFMLLLGLSLPVLGDESLLSAAAHAAAAGDYRSAARDYEQVLDRNGFSAPVLFNLGNAWLRLGKPGRAILEYERALVLAPHSAAIEANLAAAQQRAGLAPVAVGPWQAAARSFSFDTYMWAALGAVWVLCAGVVLVCLNGVGRRIARLLIPLAVLTLCASADAAALQWPDLYRAVVLAPAALHLAPAPSAAASGSLQEGEMVWLQDRFAKFALVRAADGRSGWLSDDAVASVRMTPR